MTPMESEHVPTFVLVHVEFVYVRDAFRGTLEFVLVEFFGGCFGVGPVEGKGGTRAARWLMYIICINEIK